MTEDAVIKKARISICLEQTGEGKYDSTHEIEGVDLVTAGWILIDIGRDILLGALAEARSAEKGQHYGH